MKPIFPFNDVSFFKQFDVGKTIFFLTWLQPMKETMEPLVDSRRTKPGTYLAETSSIGIYEGCPDDATVRICKGVNRFATVPVANLVSGGMKILTLEEFRVIYDDILEIGFFPASPPVTLVHLIDVVNRIREIVDANEILISRARIG